MPLGDFGSGAGGLGKPRGQKKPEKLQQRIGRLKEKSQGVSQHYRITLDTDESGQVASALTWKQELVQGSMATHPGVYCLRTNVLDWDAPRLWQMYSTLTDIESVFRSLKGELGLRPVFHQTEFRADGHLFITVLAYQCVQVIRKTLKAQGIHGSWASLRQTLSQQVRVTVTMQRSDGRSIHIRKAKSRACREADLPRTGHQRRTGREQETGGLTRKNTKKSQTENGYVVSY